MRAYNSLKYIGQIIIASVDFAIQTRQDETDR